MKRFLFSFLLAAPVLSFAQSNFQKGYVVANSKDTLKGYINFKERRRSPVTVDFRTSLDGSSQVFTLANCAAYGIDGVEHYRRFAVDVSMSKIDVSSLSIGLDQSFKRDTVFLNILQVGKNLTLFSYTDELKERFYIMDVDSKEPVELIRDLYLKEGSGNLIVADDKYIRQLLFQIKKNYPENPALERKILALRYGKTSLLKTVSLINDQQLPQSKYRNVRFFAGAGLIASKASYSGTHALSVESAKSKTSYSPMLTTGMDLFVKPEIGRLIIRTELSLLMSKNEISLFSEADDAVVRRHSFDQTTIALTPGIIYNVYNTGKLKCFIGGGFGLNFSATSNNESTYLNTISMKTSTLDEVQLEKFYFSFLFTAGVVLNKRIEISVGYSPDVAISNYSYYNVVMKRFRFGVNYLFGKY
ncbi:hypothetical protein D3C87_331590 [compost metagenome]